MRGYPHFSFCIPITLSKIYVFPIVIIFAKIYVYYEALSLSVHKLSFACRSTRVLVFGKKNQSIT